MISTSGHPHTRTPSRHWSFPALLLAATLCFVPPVVTAQSQAPLPRLTRPDSLLATYNAIPSDPSLSVEDRQLFSLAIEAAERKQWPAAIAASAKISELLAAKTIVWLWLLAEDSEATFEDSLEFLEANPGWPRRFTLRRRMEARANDDVPPATLLRFFDERPPITGDGGLSYAEALLGAGRMAEAQDVARTTWATHPLLPEEETRFLDGLGHLLGESDHITRLDRMIWNRQWNDAQRQLERVPESDRLVGEARIILARRQPGVDVAIARIPEHARSHPGLILERLRWRRRSGLYDGARELLADLPEDLGDPAPWWRESRFQIRSLLADDRPAEAHAFAAHGPRFIRRHRVEAEWLAGWIALEFLDDPDTALDHFREMTKIVGLPISVARAEFWSGRAARQLGKTEESIAHFQRAAEYPETFYGQAARRELGTEFDLSPLPAPIGEPTEFDPELIQILQMLAEVAAADVATAFAVHLFDRSQTDDQLIALYTLCYELGFPQLSITIAKRAILNGRNHPRLLFPLPDSARFPTVETHPVPPALLLAVANQESGFRIDATSPAGANGLMQLMPATARRYARKLGLPYRPAELLTDATYNLQLGVALLADLLARYQGSLPLALAAYNAGESRADRWIRVYGDPRTNEIELLNWIELIPFSETRNYVHRIIEGMRVYQSLLDCAEADSSGNLHPAFTLGERCAPRPKPPQ